MYEAADSTKRKAGMYESISLYKNQPLTVSIRRLWVLKDSQKDEDQETNNCSYTGMKLILPV